MNLLRNRFNTKHLLLLFLFFLPSCGYRFGRGELIQSYSTVCIPYVAGDRDGIFTAALIRKITSSGCLAYRSTGADLVLQVSLLIPEDINIGFIYAPADKGDDFYSNIVVSNEARVTLNASVTLLDRATGACVLGPVVMGSFLDYDFAPDLTDVNYHAFSLGQLEMHTLAQEAALPSLYNLMADKIVSYLCNCW